MSGIGSIDPEFVCRVCAGVRREPAFESPGYAEHGMCPTCKFDPGYDASDQAYSYAWWGDQWERSSAGSALERAAMRAEAARLFPKTWRVGDLLSIPARYGGYALGQIVWIHPRHYRLHVIVQDELFDREEDVPREEAPRVDLFARTVDWALHHDIWRVIGHAAVPGDLPPAQLLVLRSVAGGNPIYAVDPVDRSLLPTVRIDDTIAALHECESLIGIGSALSAGPEEVRRYQRYLFTQALADARHSATSWWRKPGDHVRYQYGPFDPTAPTDPLDFAALK